MQLLSSRPPELRRGEADAEADARPAAAAAEDSDSAESDESVDEDTYREMLLRHPDDRSEAFLEEGAPVTIAPRAPSLCACFRSQSRPAPIPPHDDALRSGASAINRDLPQVLLPGDHDGESWQDRDTTQVEDVFGDEVEFELDPIAARDALTHEAVGEGQDHQVQDAALYETGASWCEEVD